MRSFDTDTGGIRLGQILQAHTLSHKEKFYRGVEGLQLYWSFGYMESATGQDIDQTAAPRTE